jgi:hypothetical protein
LQTPTATEIGVRSPEAMKRRIAFRKSIGRNSVPPGNLLEQLQMMYPTPRAALGMSFTLTKNLAKLRHKKYLETEIAYLNRNNLKPGGKLNPNFVEFLMAYPTDWTKIEQTELKR